MPSAQGHITIRRRAKDGTDGNDAVRYWVIPSATQIKRAQDGTMYPATVTCEKRKQTGNASPVVTTEGILYYQICYEDGTISGKSAYGSTGVKATKTMVWIKFMLEVNQVEVASETVSVVRDGDDVYLLDLDNEMQGIPCNSSGTPTGTGTLASTNAIIYKGSKVDSGWTFTKTDTGCTSSINASTGTVNVSEITSDKASVKITATKDGLSLTATMSLYKVKAGAGGTSPVVYSILASASAISRDQDGNLNPTSITAYKVKTVGNSSANTTEMVLKYQRVGQDASEITLSGQGGEIKNISATCTAIILTLYNGSTVLDRESIPIVKDGTDGNDGEDALTIVVSPENITFNFDNSVIKQKVRVDVFKGGRKLQYGSDEYLCSTLEGTNRVIVTGLSWNFETDDTGSFYYTFRYTSGNNVNIDVPFTVIVNDVHYPKVIHFTTVKNGSPGQQGIQGCIYRRSKWVSGFTYHNDSALTEGIRYIDLVYLMKDSTMFASHALWFRCKKTHTSNANNAPQKTNNGTESWLEYWEPVETLEPLYTPFLLADDAVITLMQSNQILIANDEGVITAGMSGSIAGSKIRIWAGSQTPDNAPFRVDVLGALFSSNANITGKITATSGSIAGFNISGNSLTNGPDFSNDACVIFRNDTHKTFAGIGGNVLPATTGLRAVARFENEDSNNFWGLGRNIAMLLSAKNGDINHAFIGSGNGNLDGWIEGFHFSKLTLSASNTIYNGYLKIAENNKWIVYGLGTTSGVTLPTLSEVRTALGIGSSTAFCIEFTVVCDLLSQKNFWIYGRTQKKVTVNGSEATPYFTGEYPTVTNHNGARVDSWEMGPGDSITFLLVYDPNKTGTLDSSYSLMYTARIINYLQ